MSARKVIIPALGALLFLVPAVGMAQPCNPPGSPPQCDGACPPGQECVEGLPGQCICETSIALCGDGQFPPPQCWGSCPPHAPICADIGGTCACVIPTLSQWGILAMALVMLGTVFMLRRRSGEIQSQPAGKKKQGLADRLRGGPRTVSSFASTCRCCVAARCLLQDLTPLHVKI